jgi:hypothetical protein
MALLPENDESIRTIREIFSRKEYRDVHPLLQSLRIISRTSLGKSLLDLFKLSLFSVGRPLICLERN